MKNIKIWLGAVLVLVVAGIVSWQSYQQKQPIVYADHTDTVVVTVDGNKLTLRDFSYYIAAQELNVEAQAAVYDSSNTRTYWGMRLGKGKFVKTAAKESVLDAVIHDEIFYRMAVEAGFVLEKPDQTELSAKQDDFWSDLTEEQRERLGVTKEELDEVMYRAALAQKYQQAYTLEHTTDSEYYDVGEEGYEELLQQHSCKIKKKVWERVPFGEIILEHPETAGTTEQE